MQVVQDGGMHSQRVRWWLWAAGAVSGLCVTSACSVSSATTTSAAVPSPTRPASAAATRTATAAPASISASLAPLAQVTVTHVRTADGSLVTVAIFRGPVHYVLHNGSVDPGSLAAGLVRAGPVVAGSERRHLLAAFTGGFMLNNRVGGYEQEGHVISPLQRGVASLVIDRSGQARLGIWGHGLPALGEAVYSVLQNLPPLVYRGRPVATAADWRLWGPTLGGGEYVARTSVGEDSSGELIVAASMSTNPADLADALIRNGARFAMELDINPEWVQLDTATRPGGPLTAAIPGQIRPADQYLVGWTRDFVAVVAP
jgi:hypothetical protein